jgi:hypothetical protein
VQKPSRIEKRHNTQGNYDASDKNLNAYNLKAVNLRVIFEKIILGETMRERNDI